MACKVETQSIHAPCYICEWDSRETSQHYVRKNWPRRTTFRLGDKNVLNIPLVDPNNIILPPLHIKLGLMKQFVKALDKTGPAFGFLKRVFPGLSDLKIKSGKI